MLKFNSRSLKFSDKTMLSVNIGKKPSTKLFHEDSSTFTKLTKSHGDVIISRTPLMLQLKTCWKGRRALIEASMNVQVPVTVGKLVKALHSLSKRRLTRDQYDVLLTSEYYRTYKGVNSKNIRAKLRTIKDACGDAVFLEGFEKRGSKIRFISGS